MKIFVENALHKDVVMKTIKNIAEEINVTKQAVFKKIRTEPFKTKIGSHLHTISGVINIDEEGEILIKKEFEKTISKRTSTSPRKNNKETQYIEKIFVLETQIKLLEDKIVSLEKELLEAEKQKPETNKIVDREILDILKTQLENKDRQLENKDTQILNIQEQSKESVQAVKQTAATAIMYNGFLGRTTSTKETKELKETKERQHIEPPIIETKNDFITVIKEDDDEEFKSKIQWLKNLARNNK